MPKRSAHLAAPSPSQAPPSSPQRSAATSRVNAGVPRSDRAQRMSVLVTTQTKVSSGVGVHCRRVEEEYEGFVRAELGLHLFHRERYGGERCVVGELHHQPLVDGGDARVDGGEPRDVGGFSCAVPLVRRLRYGCRAHRVPLLPFLDQVLPFAHQAASAASPLAPRAAICASEAAASELCAHCAVWNISRAKHAFRAAILIARRFVALTSPKN